LYQAYQTPGGISVLSVTRQQKAYRATTTGARGGLTGKRQRKYTEQKSLHLRVCDEHATKQPRNSGPTISNSAVLTITGYKPI